MPLPPHISCFINIRHGSTFLVPVYLPRLSWKRGRLPGVCLLWSCLRSVHVSKQKLWNNCRWLYALAVTEQTTSKQSKHRHHPSPTGLTLLDPLTTHTHAQLESPQLRSHQRFSHKESTPQTTKNTSHPQTTCDLDLQT